MAIRWTIQAGQHVARVGDFLATITEHEGRWLYAVCDLTEQHEGIYKETHSFDLAQYYCEHYLNSWSAA